MASFLSFSLPNPTRPICASAATTQTPPTTLQQKFGRKGVTFTESGTVELVVRNGSSLKVRIEDGLVTSYRPKVYWRDDGFEEVLHLVEGVDGRVRGGIALVVCDSGRIGKDGRPWQAEEWEVKDVDSDSIDAVQVELNCTNGDGSLEITYVISLYDVSMATAVIVKNKGRKPATLTSAMMNHLKFKKRGGSAMQGLKGCSFCTHPPLPSKFEIMSPAEAMKREAPGWSIFGTREEPKQGLWTVEEEKFTILRNKISRVYAAQPTERSKRIYNTAPSKYETIDQGTGLGFRIIRMGYEDIYVGSPGSISEKYGKDYFVCTGPASILVPVVLNPGEDWRAAQLIEHDNL